MVDIPEVDAASVPSRINVATREVESVRRERQRGRRRPQPRPARDPAGEPGALPDLLEGQDAPPRLRAGAHGGLGAARGAGRRAARAARGGAGPEPEPQPPGRAGPGRPRRPRAARAPDDRRRRPLAPRVADPLRRLPARTTGRSRSRSRPTARCATRTSSSATRTASCSTSRTSPARRCAPVEVNRDPVRKVRLGQFSTTAPRIARLVLDLSTRAPYRIIEGADGMKIVFGEGETPRPAPLASLRSEGDAQVEPADAGAPPAILLPAPAPRRPCRRPARRPAGSPRPRARSSSSRCPHLGREAVHGPPDQPRLQGRRPPGHLPALRRHQRAEHRGQPRRHRQGHPEAERGPLGPGPRPDPEGEQPRLHAREQRHPHRPPGRPAARGAGAPQAGRGARAGRRPRGLQPPPLLRQGRGAAADGAEGGPERARHDHPRRPDQHDDHHRPPGEHRAGQGPDHRPRPRHVAGRDRGPHRGHQPKLHPRPRHPVGLPEPADPAVQQHHQPRASRTRSC